MKTYKSWSTERPEIWDKESCPDKVYHNFHIVESQIESGDMDEPMAIFEYDVEEYTNKEFIILQSEQLDEQADAIIELAEMIIEGGDE